MSKNLTRKGLALGAVVALSSTLIAGSPAFAEAAITVAPSAGTTYNVLASDSFTVKVFGNSDFAFVANGAAGFTDLRWAVTKPVDQAIAYDAQEAATATAQSNSTSTIDYVLPSAVSATVGRNTLTINPTTTSTTATFAVTVQAYVELDDTAGLSAGDLKSAPQTINFIKGSEVTATVALDTPAAGSATKANVTLDKGINLEQTTLANHNVKFTVNGTAADQVSSALNTDKTAIVATGASASAGQIISVQAQNRSYDSAAFANSGVVSGKTVSAASTVDASDIEIANSANIRDTATAGSLDKQLRKGTKTIDFDVAFEKAGLAASAGAPVTVTLAEVNDSIVVGDVLTINGTKLTGSATSAQSVVVNTATDAAGIVKVSLVSTLASTSDEVTITVVSNSISKVVALKWVDAVIEAVVDANAPLNSATRTVVRGGAIAVDYSLVDQFGQPWTKTDYAYRLSFGVTGAATAPQPVVFAAGKAALAFTDNSTSVTDYAITGTLQFQTSTNAWATYTTTSETVVSNINVVSALPVAGSITVPSSSTLWKLDDGSTDVATAGVPLAGVTLVALDNRVNSSIAGLGVTDNKGVKVTGTVTATTGAAMPGAAVVITAPGVAFSTTVGGTGVVTLGSITVNTDASGAFAVFAYSNTSGSVTFTYTSGTATATKKLLVANPATTAGKALNVDAPASILPGRTLVITGSVADKYGNKLVLTANDSTTGQAGATLGDLVVSYTGPGLVVGELPSATDSSGSFSVRVLLGAGDSGSAVLTAKYDANGDEDYTDTGDLTVAKTVTIGAAAVVVPKAAVIATKNGRVYVTVNYKAGFKAYVKVGFSVKPSFTTTGSKLVSYYVGAGKRVAVRVYVRGGIAASQAVTVK